MPETETFLITTQSDRKLCLQSNGFRVIMHVQTNHLWIGAEVETMHL